MVFKQLMSDRTLDSPTLSRGRLVWRMIGCFLAAKLALISWLMLGYAFWPEIPQAAQETIGVFIDFTVLALGAASSLGVQTVLRGLSDYRSKWDKHYTSCTKWQCVLAGVGVGIALRYAAESLSIGWTWLVDPDGFLKLGEVATKMRQGLVALGTSDTIELSGLKIVMEGIQIALLAPVAEEIAYRGILLRQFCRALAPHWAVLLSAVLFSTMHGLSPGSMLAGIVLGYFFLYTGNVIYPMLAHSAGNALVVLYPYLPWNLSLISITGAFNHSWQVVISLFSWTIVIGVLWLAIAQFRRVL